MNEQAKLIAVKVIKLFEGCNLIAYPDPASPLYKALATHGMLKKYMDGVICWKDLQPNFKLLSGVPWTCGWGETNGVTKDAVWTQQEADSKLDTRVAVVMSQCLKDCPRLASEAPERIAAITSLAYNIGATAFKNSTACKKIKQQDDHEVGPAIKMWDKGGEPLKVMAGLVRRRQMEADLWNSGRK